MYYECRMILQSYVPDQPRKGMLFMTLINNNPYVYELNNVRDYDNYVIESGFPVLPYIYDIGNPNLENHAIIAVPDQIGWFDVGEHSDELIDVEVKHINAILQDYETDA